jgi:drug/metabolite transporter (DMT)-like permease
MRRNGLLLAYLSLAFICLSWGTTYLALRIGVEHYPPFLFSGTRQVIAGLVMISAAVWFFKIEIPKMSEMKSLGFAGLLMITGGNGFVAWAEMYVSSGVAALICSIMPVWVIIINLITKAEEKPNMMITSGVGLGVVGLLLVFQEFLPEFANPRYAAGILLTILATITWAYGSIYSKAKSVTKHPLMLGGFQLFFGGAGMFVLSVLFDDYKAFDYAVEGLHAMIYLIIVGSILSFTAFHYALQRLPVTLVSAYTYVNPLVAIILGWLILDEKLNEWVWLAFFVTVGGIWLVNRGYQKKSSPIVPIPSSESERKSA